MKILQIAVRPVLYNYTLTFAFLGAFGNHGNEIGIKILVLDAAITTYTPQGRNCL